MLKVGLEASLLQYLLLLPSEFRGLFVDARCTLQLPLTNLLDMDLNRR